MRPSITSRICARAIFFHPLLDDTNCSDQFRKGALAEVWGGRVVYSGLIDDGDPPGDFFNYTGAISWTGELGFGASAGGELFTTSILSGAYDIATGIATGTGPGNTGNGGSGFSCWNNPIAVDGFGANFCGNAPDGRESR